MQNNLPPLRHVGSFQPRRKSSGGIFANMTDQQRNHLWKIGLYLFGLVAMCGLFFLGIYVTRWIWQEPKEKEKEKAAAAALLL